MAARIAYHGVGEFIEIGNLTVESLTELILRVQKNPDYRNRAEYFRKVIAENSGLDVAANLMENALWAKSMAA